jgi:hypothetical protein
MKDARLAFGENIIPLKAPVDSAGTAYATNYVNAQNLTHLTFVGFFGVVTATSADQSVVVTLEASTAATSNATEVAIGGKYRKSGAVGANTWGAVTTFGATGIEVTTTDDGLMFLVDVDLADIERAHGQRDAKYVRAVVGIDAGGTVTLNAVWAIGEPMYPQVTHLSTT